MKSNTREHQIPTRVRSGWVVLVIGLLSLVGCNRSGLDLAPVEGVVTYNGTPLADAGVLFTPANGPYAMGVTDGEGRFSLTTANHEGALIGEHGVSISKSDTIVKYVQGSPFPDYIDKPLIPPKYFDASTSQLTATVKDDDNEFEFNLTGR